MSRSSFALTSFLLFSLAVTALAQPAPSPHIGGQSATNQDQPSDAKTPATPSIDIMRAPEQVRRIAPPSFSASAKELEQTADSLRVQKLYADSVDYYRAALPRASNPDVLYNKMGIAELLMLRLGEAKKSFEKAIKSNKSNPEAYNNLGVVHYEERNYRRAIKFYNKAIELNPDSASFHSNLGSAYFSRKDYEKANQEYARALTLDPEVFEHHSPAGVSMHATTLEDRARFSYVIAKMYAKSGDTDRCLQYLRKAMEEGFAVAQNFAKDREFDNYRKDSRFVTLLTEKPVPLPN
jgi:tetratricopeptide (TPR) repeat protein